LRHCARTDVYGQIQMVTAQNAARQIVQVNQRPTVIQLKRSDDPQRQLLLAFSEDCLIAVSTRFETQAQLTMNTRS